MSCSITCKLGPAPEHPTYSAFAPAFISLFTRWQSRYPPIPSLPPQSHASCLPLPLHSHPTPRDGAESHVAYAVIDLWTAGCPGAGTMQASRLPRPLEQRLVWDYRQLLLYACLILRSRRPPTAISTTVLTLSRKDSPSALLGDRFRRSF